jgi:hypothetical protein
LDVFSQFRGGLDERTVPLLYPTFNKELVELPLKFFCLRQDEKAGYLGVKALSNVKREPQREAHLMEDVLSRIIYSCVNWDACRLVHNNESVVLMQNRRRPIDSFYRKPLRL